MTRVVEAASVLVNSRTVRRASRVALPALVIAGGVAGAAFMIENRARPQPVERGRAGAVVEARVVEQVERRFAVTAQGQVTSARELAVQPEVAGRIVAMHDQLIPGGLIAKGDVLFSIDRRKYALTVSESRTAVADARARLRKEEGRQRVARQEWELFNQGRADDQAGALALREPDYQQAVVSVDAARARLARAELDLARTRYRAPFDAIVKDEAAERDLLVSTQTRLATLVATDAFWVQVSVPVEELARIAVPGVNASEGARAVVWQDQGEHRIERTGRVVRLMSDVDPVGTMARVLVEIDDPLALDTPVADRPLPMLLGSFVHVRIEGRAAESVIALDRHELRDGDRVFVIAADDTLDIREVAIAWADRERVYLRAGVAAGERVVTSGLVAPVAGMELDVAGAAMAERAAPGAPDRAGGER